MIRAKLADGFWPSPSAPPPSTHPPPLRRQDVSAAPSPPQARARTRSGTASSWPNKPVTPTTALALSKTRVFAGSSRLTAPLWMPAATSSSTASISTLRPNSNAFFGLMPLPTPPCFAPGREPQVRALRARRHLPAR
jgi:hypothetical protein